MTRASVVRQIVLRSFLVQGSWNYRTLIGSGIAWVLLPVLRDTDDQADRIRRIARESELFNSHPYLSTLAAGALARAELQDADPERIRAFRDAIRSPLGSLGDRLVWSAWQPVCLVAAILLVTLGVAPWIVVAGLLIGYNSVHLALRIWGARVGWDMGFEVGEGIRNIDLARQTERITTGGVLLLGFLSGVLLHRGPDFTGPGSGWWVASIALFLVGFSSGATARRWAPSLLILVVLVGLLV